MKKLLIRPGLIADVLALVSLLLFLFLIGGEVFILIGAMQKMALIENLILRGIHLAVALLIFGEAIVGRPSALLVWEDRFRLLAGQTLWGKSLLGRITYAVLLRHRSEKVQRIVRLAVSAVVIVTFAVLQPKWSL